MPPPAATPEIVAVAPCAWLETVDAANPAATARAKRIEVNFGSLFMSCPFEFIQCFDAKQNVVG
jgi:hypothetical protein